MNDATQFFNTTAADTGYQIPRSLRFNSSDSAYLSRTPSTAGNRKTFTFSCWVKLTTFGSDQAIFAGTDGSTSNQFEIRLQSDSTFFLNTGGDPGNRTIATTSAVFRDPSAWYHLVCAVDTTQASASNHFKFYINNSLQTLSLTASGPQNLTTQINGTFLHHVGVAHTLVRYFNGYLADINFIDGQALDPTSFGEFNDDGVWQAKQYTGSYGTNGFHLPCSDNSTAAALGTDTSGNGNDWGVNNISVTAGADNDSFVDSPTNGDQTDTGVGGEVVGNYATLNPLDKANLTLSNGNLDLTHSGTTGNWQMVRATIGVSSGKWYWETTVTDTETILGIAKSAASIANDNYVGNDANGWGYSGINGQKLNSGSGSAYGNSYTSGDVIGVAFDADAGSLYFYKNGTVQNSGTAAFTSLTSGPYFPAFSIRDTGHTSSVNLGQRPFAYTAPSGFKALCTTNLPEPTIADGSTAMDVKLYTGNGSTQTISGLNFSPDFIWFKARSSALSHQIFDQIRGVTKVLFSDSTAGEGTETDRLTAFNSDGFTLGTDAAGRVNGSGTTYVAWTWDAGSSTVSNTDGSITSSVRANASAGFSIVSYTGTGSLATIGHGLNAAPELILVKSRTNAENWAVYSKAAGAANRLILNLTVSAASGNEYWNSTDPTSSVFTVNIVGQANGSGQNYVAYCFAPVDGYSSFGSYTGNGSADGPFVYTGFKPRWILWKSSTTTVGWAILDTSRDSYNVSSTRLYPNDTLGDDPLGSGGVDILSNGFKVKTTDGFFNYASQTYIYAAFAENPFALNARAR